jgi:hypothetical protein
MKTFPLAGQVSTFHSGREMLTSERVIAAVTAVQSIVPLSILAVGAHEIPEIFHRLTDTATRPVGEIYLWYNLLSDYPSQQPGDGVVNFRGVSGSGWQGWQESGAEVEESFQFGCPNNPTVRQKTLSGLEGLLRTYPFDGVFLDKLRFPSPAGGLEMALSCFCPHCYQAAARLGLDLDRVKACLQDRNIGGSTQGGAQIPPGSPWLEALCQNYPLLQAFLRFRADSVTGLVREVRELTNRMGRKLALDMFSPAFAALVGQDYSVLAALADWVKPMTYRRAFGPAGFRLEAQSLFNGIERIYHVPEEEIFQWAEHNYPDFTAEGYRRMLESLVPLEWMRAEIYHAVEYSGPTPVYMGLETVHFPGVIQITPDQVREMLTTGIACGVHGAVISWDVLNTPLENIRAIRNCL